MYWPSIISYMFKGFAQLSTVYLGVPTVYLANHFRQNFAKFQIKLRRILDKITPNFKHNYAKFQTNLRQILVNTTARFQLKFTHKNLLKIVAQHLSNFKRAFTLKQYRPLLYHQATKQYITYGISHCSSMRGPVEMNQFCS